MLNLSFIGIDSEAIIVAWKDLAAVSNGAACTSQSYTLSHVLKAMGVSDQDARGAVRLSWCHLTGEVDWQGMATATGKLL